MKYALVTSLFMVGSIGFAHASDTAVKDKKGVWADGYVSYIHPNGELVNRECSLRVPVKGEGKVKLKCGDWSTKTNNFETYKSNGKTVFSIIFSDMKGAPEGTVALYSGAYMRGTNSAIYYGDVLSGNSNTTSCNVVDMNYIGGFMFKADID